MQRRDFIKNVAIAGVIAPQFINGFSIRALAQAPLIPVHKEVLSNDRVLVLIQLNGGNDGLNTVIPLDQYGAYQAARPNIALPQDKILKLNGFDTTGVHPALSEFTQLFNDGKAGIVQAVSYPKPNFSHFRATDIWMTGSDADKILTTGWAGRYLSDTFPGFPDKYPNDSMPDPLAIQIGSVIAPAFQGPTFSMGIAISNPTNFYNLIDDKTAVSTDSRWGEQLAYLEKVSQKTDQYSDVIRKAAQKVTKQSDKYPSAGKNPLADQLKIVARLIAGGLQTKVYLVSMSGFDTHARQTEPTDTTTGTHAQLLRRVSEAIGAFMDDLNGLTVADRVMGMTFSEFGRRVKSNASGGTDHGSAAPVLYFGNSIKAGVIGTNPQIPATATVNDNIALQHDFRSVYATVLQQWLGLPASQLQTVLMESFPILPMV
ncbi:MULTISPECIES: DUF1501 domain-containing protein [unclassified Spirosoma]|uniref:DUF1501 domain-containing protein n=1 Tax=unclassified Spirosoma TaxID=2621999 RepID=UPI0009598CB3|nr:MULTISPECIES: DUF1501 domain-containing protein [unclassified Spirosoma]MBN8822691.1 DUF1501 domain-containing protein [Spirosoma sp.]OJW79905.1 MAG: hypothetical protein BGO59_01440 [Spirosoma sp. 48-14]